MHWFLLFLINFSLIYAGNSANVVFPLQGNHKNKIKHLESLEKTDEGKGQVVIEMLPADFQDQKTSIQTLNKSKRDRLQLHQMSQLNRRVFIQKLLKNLLSNWVFLALDGSREQLENQLFDENELPNLFQPFPANKNTYKTISSVIDLLSRQKSEKGFDFNKRQHWSTGLAPGGK